MENNTQYQQNKRNSVAEQHTVIPPSGHRAIFNFLHKVLGSLPRSLQCLFIALLNRTRDPEPEAYYTDHHDTIETRRAFLGWLPGLALTSTLGMLSVAYAFANSRDGEAGLRAFFYLGLLLIYTPTAVRLISPVPSRLERIGLLCVLGISFYLIQLMISPLHFSSYDEFLHWRTADDILRTRHLFSENSMLTVSPYYPGLEIVTNAISTTSSLDTFHACISLLIIIRLLMVFSLFLLYEQITRSSRMAGIATIIYMANPHFLLFDGIFNYETLALPLATFMLYILAHYQTTHKNYRWAIFAAWIALLAVTMTHHMTDYVFDSFLIIWTFISLFYDFSENMRIHLAAITLFGVLLSLAYAFLLKGNPVRGYLSDYYGHAFTNLEHITAGTSTIRHLFNTNQAIPPTPIEDRLLMAASVALVICGLPFGLLTLWQQYRHNALAIMFGIVSLAYPITQVFRFTDFGAEITDRAAAFLFLPIAYLLTIFITHFWPTQKLSWKASLLIACAISVVSLGGVILEAGPAWSNLPGPYLVVADVRSVEPEGIQAAIWSLTYLGPDNRIATDRINQSLMISYGDQRIVTGSDDKVDVAPIFYSSRLDPEEVAILRQAKVRYLVVDQRLSTSLPLLGFYFEGGEAKAFRLTSPISRKSLAKFKTISHIKRVFDSGNIVIYDVGGLINAPEEF